MQTLLFGLAIFLLPILAAPQTAASAQPAAGDAQRSIILEMDGYAYISEDKTIKETRQEALVNSKRQAVEAAGSNIRSKTRVENFVVDFDEVIQNAEGAVRVLKLEDLGIQPDNRYKVRIKAEVVFTLRPASGKADADPLADPTAPLTVRVWSDRSEYREGDKITLKVKANRDCFIRVLDFMPDGTTVQLLPNAHRRYAHFKGGRVYEIPGPGDQFDLTVTPPFGVDEIKAYASERPLGDAQAISIGGGLLQVRGTKARIGDQLRGIHITPSPSPGGSHSSQPAEFVEAGWTITTRP